MELLRKETHKSEMVNIGTRKDRISSKIIKFMKSVIKTREEKRSLK